MKKRKAIMVGEAEAARDESARDEARRGCDVRYDVVRAGVYS